MTKIYKLCALVFAIFTVSQATFGQMKKSADNGNPESVAKAKATLKASAGKIWFQENKGQVAPSVQYLFSTNFGSAYVEQNSILLVAKKEHEANPDLEKFNLDSNYEERQYVRLSFPGAAEKFNITPINPLVTNINYFTSETPEGFIYGVKAYSELYIKDVYAGVDLRIYSVAKGQMEFDWVLNRASDFTKIQMKVDGHDAINLLPDGGFNIQCRFQGLNFKMPESYQVVNDEKQLVDIRYVLNGENQLAFETGSELRPELPLVIDPTVMWATYMEETGGDYLFGSESDNCGRVYLAGRTKDAHGTGGGAQYSQITGATGYDKTFNTGTMTILYIFSADGDSIKAFSYFGSNNTPADLDLFPNGRVLVAGSMRGKSGSPAGSIPYIAANATNGTTGKPEYQSYSRTGAMRARGWLAIFDSEFSHLYYSTNMPGTNGTFSSLDEKGVTCVEIVDDNTYYACGITDTLINGSSAAPATFVNTSSTPDASFSNGEGYITRFGSSGANVYNQWNWGTYIGCDANDIFLSIKLSSDGTKLAFAGNFDVGTTSGAGFPARVNPVDNTSAGDEGFAGYLNNQATNPGSFGMLTFIGGAGDEGDVLVETMKEYVYAFGYTNSASFPGTTGITGFTPYQGTIKGDYESFVSKIPLTGSTVSGGITGGAFRTTYFGGSGTELSGGIIFNTNDSNLYLFITTGSASVAQIGALGYPTVNTNPPSNFFDGNHDRPGSSTWTPQDAGGIAQNADISFVTITRDLTSNLYTSYCGGSQRDYLGNTGRLNGAGHYGFNRLTNIYSLGTTIHSNDLAARGSYVFSPNSFDSAVGTGDDHFIVKFSLSNTDMGDAPLTFDGSNATAAAHGTNSLGLQVAKFGVAITDYDAVPASSTQADGDDNLKTGPVLCANLLDDEDGLVSVPTITVETSGNQSITYNGVNALNGAIPLTAVTFTFSGATITATKTAHGLTVGQTINIAGGTGNNTVLNGTWTVATVAANTFTFVVGSTPAGVLSSMTVNANPANVYAWIDFNADGVFQVGEAANNESIVSRTILSGVTFTFSGTTITGTSTAHGMATNDWIGIAGAEGNGSVLNGLWQLTATTANTFTFTVGSTPAGTLSPEFVQKVTRSNLTWNLTGKVCPTSIVGGRTYLRMRITDNDLADNAGTTALDERSRGIAQNGEIEDHVIYIRGRDYGDLPAGYGAASAMVYEDINENGVPETAGAVWLGSVVDIEKDCAANNSALANGDDIEISVIGADDEDGVVFPSPSAMHNGLAKNFTLNFGRSTALTPIFYGMWFDWNGDGDFTDPTDQFYNNGGASTTAASATVTVTPPAGVTISPYYAVRTMVRASAAFTSGNYNLVYDNGEIEDNINNPGILISGTVFDDGDGTFDNPGNAAAVDGTPGGVVNKPVPTGSVVGTQLWAYLVSPASAIIDSTRVLENGTYSLQGAAASTGGYTVRISTTQVAIGGIVPAVTLPTDWASVGETNGINNAAGSGSGTLEASTAASNSTVTVTTGTLPITALNFGINRRPESNNATAPSQVNSGTPQWFQVPGLTGSDLEQGTLRGNIGGTPGMGGKTIVIESLPGNATVRYNGVVISSIPVGGYVIANYDSTLLQVDPTFIGVGTVTFTYAWRDSTQLKDASPATITMPFSDPTIQISGSVFHDQNGTNDGLVNGTALPRPSSTQLYAYVVNSSNVVLDSQYILTNGTYTLTAPSSTNNLRVLISSTGYPIGATVGANTLPANWANVGEKWGTVNSAGPVGGGIEGTTLSANGSVAVNAQTANITGIDFGLEWAPQAFDKTYVVSPNSVTGLTGNTPFSHFLYLNASNGTADGTVNNIVVGNMPGYVSGDDLEEGKFNGLTGSNPAGGDDTIVFTQLPDFNSTVLVYQPTAGNNILLVPNPTCPGNAACVYWDAVNSRYRIPDFDASKLLMMFKMNGQLSDVFKYAYIDAAGRLGSIATYTINYTVGLPVTISDLQCGNSTDGVGLTWNVANSVDMVSMDVMKSNGNGLYKSIHHMTDFVRTEWNQTYSYTDVNPGEGTLLYRIDGSDKDGKTEISDVCFTRIVNRIDKTVMDLAPNPTTGKTLLSIRSSDDAVYNIVMFDQAGRNIQNITATSNNGFVTQTLDLSSQAEGVYLVRVSWNGNTETFKVVRN